MMGLLSKGLRQVAWMMAAVIIFVAYAWILLFAFIFFPIWWPIERYWMREERERAALECVTDFPDDQIDGRKIVQPGGRAVACAVSDLLKDAGMITTIPELDYEHGWEFDAAQNGRKYWLLVTDLADHKMLIYTKDHSPLWRLLGRTVNWCD